MQLVAQTVSIRMSLPHALLTALAERSCSGSELAERFDKSIGFFWHATHQQIYRELARLEASGWVESLPPESGRGRKRVYRLLPAGRKELKRWAAHSEDPKPMRSELMLRLRADAVIGPTGVERDIERRLQQHKAQLALYESLHARDFSGKALTREAQVQALILQAGIQLETLWVTWSEQALKVLAKKPPK